MTELSGSARFCSGMFYVCPLSPPNGEREGVRGKHLKIKRLLTPAPFVIRANWRNLRIKTFFKKLPENGMVPFSFPQPLLKSWVMKERSWPSSLPLSRRSLGEEGSAKNPHEPNGKDGVSTSPIGTHHTSLCDVHPSIKNWVQRHAGKKHKND